MNADGGIWRHELKYVCTAQQLKIVENRIKPLLKPDPHTGPGGSYHISSVYFDDEWNSCFWENEDGTDPREKFRIRIYNGSDEKITLELKQKMRGMTRKKSCPLSRQQCSLILKGEVLKTEEKMPLLLQKFTMEQKERRLKAKVIVEYDRVPYIFRLGNVRITLDENILSSMETDRFLEGGYPRRPIMPMGQHVLEVKYDEFLPDPIRQLLQLESLQRTSFSKYYLCRKYSV
ncbi:MAG: polyphosphate polymerase domain-containing protein [Lachnospiraceae bacterium]|nr:polyphosphate polymerase domain-containing protein [Lachnospiraceae bacterium]